MSDSWIRPHQRDKDRPKFGVRACELDREGWKDELKVASIQEVSRTEERGTKLSFCENPLRDLLRDSALPRPGQPIQPIDRRLAEIPCPKLDPVQDGFASSPQTTFTAAMSIFSCLGAAETIEDARVGC